MVQVIRASGSTPNKPVFVPIKPGKELPDSATLNCIAWPARFDGRYYHPDFSEITIGKREMVLDVTQPFYERMFR